MPRVLTSLLLICCLSGLVPGGARAAVGEASSTFVLHGGEHGLGAWPIEIPIPPALLTLRTYQLIDAESGAKLPLQSSSDQAGVFLLDSPLPPNASRTFRIEAAGQANPFPLRATALEVDGNVELKIGDRSVLTYRCVPRQPPKTIDPRYRRSGHIHPVRTPSGRIVTEEFPADHPHQHAVFAAWVNTTFEGRSIDFWNQAQGTGTVEHVELLDQQSGTVFCGFTARLQHLDLTQTPARAVLIEEWKVRCYAVPTGHLFEILSVQRCAGQSPLKLNEYHYGGMAYRGPTAWLGAEGHQFMTDAGLNAKTGNHTRPRWVAIQGKLDGADCGLAMLSHPSNFRSPQPVRLHPSKPYFVFSPVVLGEFEISPAQPYSSRYLLFAFDGAVPQNLLESLWRSSASTPALEWK